MLILKQNERKEETLSNMKIDGFSVKVRMSSTDYTTYVDNTDVDFARTLLKVVLKRDGQQFIIMQDDLKSLGIESNIASMARRSFYQERVWSITTTQLSPTVHGESMLTFDIDLGGILDLHGNDELLVECSLGNGFFSSGVIEASAYLELKAIKCIGFEKYVPITRSYAIQAGERRKSWELGNNVTRVTALNYNQFYHYQPVIATVTLSSSKLDETYTFFDLVNNRLRNRPDQGDSSGASIGGVDEFDQCFCLIENTELDKVSVDVQFNPEYVTANNNILVVRSAYTDVKTLIEHDAKVQQAQSEKIAELKQNGDNAKI